MHLTTAVCGSLVPTLHIKNESVPVRTEVGTYCTLPYAGAAQVVRPVRPWPDQYSMGGIRHKLICMVRIVN